MADQDLTQIATVNGAAWEFTFGGWRYQLICILGSEYVRLYYQHGPGCPWEFGHERPLEGRELFTVVEEMYNFVTGG
jgi:hypothetical protein